MSINTEKVLRSLETEKKIFRNTKRMDVIKAVDCVMALSRLGMDTPTIKQEIQKLLESYKLVKVKVNEKDKEHVELSLGKTVSASDYYMWTNEKTDYRAIILVLLGAALVITFCLHKIWPYWMKVVAKYVWYAAMAFFGFLGVISLVRLIVFVVTYMFCSSGLWIYPNLFGDYGFYDSFVPMYSWESEDTSHKDE